MISTFHQQIVDKLKTLDSIKQVDFAYNNASEKYPEACVQFVEMNEEYETQIQVRRIYSFNVMVSTLVGNKDRNVAYKEFEDLLWGVRALFGRNSIENATLTRPTESAVYSEVQNEQQKIIGTVNVLIENIERVEN